MSHRLVSLTLDHPGVNSSRYLGRRRRKNTYHLSEGSEAEQEEDDDDDVQHRLKRRKASATMFEEWPLGDAILKRVTVGEQSTFQLQFDWNPAVHNELPVKTRQATNQSVAWSSEEEDFLVDLKSQKESKLSWKAIHAEFKAAFPQSPRTLGTLQVRYCTKLKEKEPKR